MVHLDFFSGSHGHFLEYVINTWLFKGPRVSNVFTPLGASHMIRRSAVYMENRIVVADHYSEFDKPCDSPSKIVRITINQDWSNWIYQINVLARAGDIPLEKKLELTPAPVRDVPQALRNEWYAKFNQSDHGYNLPGNWRWPHIPAYDFPMESLFDHTEFYKELYRLSSYLEITFVPDHVLASLLTEFLSRNQGWIRYLQAQQIVNSVLTGIKSEFASDVISQALVNSLLSKSVGIFDGELFDRDDYPTNTNRVWEIVEQHLTTFDSKF